MGGLGKIWVGDRLRGRRDREAVWKRTKNRRWACLLLPEWMRQFTLTKDELSRKIFWVGGLGCAKSFRAMATCAHINRYDAPSSPRAPRTPREQSRSAAVEI